MRIGVRIKFSEDYGDQRALAAVGGEITFPKGKPPQFSFSSQVQYHQYLKLRKEKTPTVAPEDVE
ncbi:hypothetical protein J2Z69_000742 [Paenibacillus shirakamiensis]|uniref:Uncharacterized protein n=1 Tax=Paenibacillus shirakamiensis TaxID=1265935 RepID=A0ABS4JDE5_9BACL|nr:hypothetical protein [Paenibacillus shirakamiensis]MBP1999723.1 hypothetical protein [Paenibacillus shirakamiensis]